MEKILLNIKQLGIASLMGVTAVRDNGVTRQLMNPVGFGDYILDPIVLLSLKLFFLPDFCLNNQGSSQT